MHAPSTQLDPGPPRRLAHQQVQIPSFSILQHYADVVLASLSQPGIPVRFHVAEKPLHGFPVPGADHHVCLLVVQLSWSPRCWIPLRSNIQHARDFGEKPVLLSSGGDARPHLAPVVRPLHEPQTGCGVGRQPRYGHVPGPCRSESHCLRHVPPFAHEELPRGSAHAFWV
jgi:hypothetical protein